MKIKQKAKQKVFLLIEFGFRDTKILKVYSDQLIGLKHLNGLTFKNALLPFPKPITYALIKKSVEGKKE
jgi:hypothetical protein